MRVTTTSDRTGWFHVQPSLHVARFDETMLDASEDYVKRRKEGLGVS